MDTRVLLAGRLRVAAGGGKVEGLALQLIDAMDALALSHDLQERELVADRVLESGDPRQAMADGPRARTLATVLTRRRRQI